MRSFEEADKVATFYSHGFAINEKKAQIQAFLRISNSTEFIRTCALPTRDDIYALCMLLVLEHPQITPAWLDSWMLYDKSDSLHGLKQVGSSWVAISYKKRRGTSLAQQEIILTPYSKKIIDTILRFTSFARNSLKEIGDPNYRKMLLICTLQKALPIDFQGNSATISVARGRSKFNKSLSQDSYDKNGKLILSKEDANKLATVVSLRPLRCLRVLQIYLETQNLHAAMEALGHKKVQIDLIGRYLPQSVMNFFNDRWVRIFQNALMYELMKDSPLLNKALDFDSAKLDEFLNNHRIKELPQHLKQISSSEVDRETKHHIISEQSVVLLISVGLLQWLIAISSFVEAAMPNDYIPSIYEKWYETSKFILSWLDADKSIENRKKGELSPEIYDLYELAKANPLCLNTIKEKIC